MVFAYIITNSTYNFLPVGLCVVMHGTKLPVTEDYSVHFCQFPQYHLIHFKHSILWNFSDSSENWALKDVARKLA